MPLTSGSGRLASVLSLSALTGVVIVLLADAVGQILPSGPYPVGLITGALGAPVLLSVLLRKGN